MPGEDGGMQATGIGPVPPPPESVQRITTAIREARDSAPMTEQRTQAPRQVRTARFIKRKETPGTVVFQEQPPDGEPEIIGNIYVRKWFAGNAQSITVTVEKG